MIIYNNILLQHFNFFVFVFFFFQLPLAEKRPGGLSVLEVDDPKLCVLLHLMTPMTSIEPDLESPLARPLQQQKSVATEILGEVGSAKSATEGMLLSNMESNGLYNINISKFAYFKC